MIERLESRKLLSAAYPWHAKITATEFWVGESADSSNHNIPNAQSAWDDHWLQHFGGIDDPNSRNGLLPAGFTPKENPFYFALPYDDFTNAGTRRPDARRIFWAGNKSTWNVAASLCKNQWIEINEGSLTCYAQWEDVGPFGENDVSYVFGNARPANPFNQHAGLDLSPATTQLLGLNGEERVSWRFVPAASVPTGPWSQTVTTSQIDWT